MNFRIVFLLLLVYCLISCVGPKIFDLRPEKQKTQGNFALLKVPMELDIVYLNKQKIDIMTPYRKIITYKVPTGNLVVGLQYNDLLYNEDNNQEVVKSKVVQLEFPAKAGETYTIRFKKPRNTAEAAQMLKNLTLSLYHGKTSIAKSTKNDLWQISAAINKASDHLPFESAPDHPQKPPGKSESADKHLLYWWTKASQTERQRFLQELQQ